MFYASKMVFVEQNVQQKNLYSNVLDICIKHYIEWYQARNNANGIEKVNHRTLLVKVSSFTSDLVLFSLFFYVCQRQTACSFDVLSISKGMHKTPICKPAKYIGADAQIVKGWGTTKNWSKSLEMGETQTNIKQK